MERKKSTKRSEKAPESKDEKRKGKRVPNTCINTPQDMRRHNTIPGTTHVASQGRVQKLKLQLRDKGANATGTQRIHQPMCIT